MNLKANHVSSRIMDLTTFWDRDQQFGSESVCRPSFTSPSVPALRWWATQVLSNADLQWRANFGSITWQRIMHSPQQYLCFLDKPESWRNDWIVQGKSRRNNPKPTGLSAQGACSAWEHDVPTLQVYMRSGSVSAKDMSKQYHAEM